MEWAGAMGRCAGMEGDLEKTEGLSLVVLATMLCLWTVVAYAITLHVTDDVFAQKEAPNALSGAAVALSIDNRNLQQRAHRLRAL